MIKTYIFDFDGTLSQGSSNLWLDLWQELGLSLREADYLRRQYYGGKFDYETWVALTMELFKNAGFNYSHLRKCAKNTQLKPGIPALFSAIRNSGAKIFIITGGICEGVKLALGDAAAYVNKIYGNRMSFEKDGSYSYTIPTKFDDQGKCDLVNFLCQKHNLNPQEILYVGNDENDEFVHQSGCKTFCITPTLRANPTNSKIWTEGYSTKIDNMLKLFFKGGPLRIEDPRIKN